MDAGLLTNIMQGGIFEACPGGGGSKTNFNKGKGV